MKLKGGVIVIGSLLWDEEPIRTKWRAVCFNSLNEKVPVPVPIRYGRQSSTRSDTYTMIFSNNESTKLGQAYILEFKEEIKSYRVLERQAFALGAAEGLWTIESPSINKRWGTVGLLLNPALSVKDKTSSELITNRWARLYEQYQLTFDHSLYKIDKEEKPVIDQRGFLQLPWMPEMDNFDLLLATPVVPNPKRILASDEIARQMVDNGYRTYYDNNIANGIQTHQDGGILEYLNDQAT
jgi:hypothetical protein